MATEQEKARLAVKAKRTSARTTLPRVSDQRNCLMLSLDSYFLNTLAVCASQRRCVEALGACLLYWWRHLRASSEILIGWKLHTYADGIPNVFGILTERQQRY